MKNSNEDELWHNFNRAMIELGWAGKKSHETADGLALRIARKGILSLDDMRYVSPLTVGCDEIIESAQIAKERILALANATAKETQKTQHAD